MNFRKWALFALVVFVGTFGASTAFAFGVALSDVYQKLVQWKKQPVKYYVNPAGSDDVPNESDIKAITESFADWTALPCGNLSVQFAGDTDATNLLTGEQPNYKNELTFVETSAWKYGKYVLGVTAPLFGYNGEIFESDIAFNGYLQSWGTTGNFGKVDVKAIAIHEVGHFFGIQHVLGGYSQFNPPTMAPSWDGSVKQRSLEDDDKLAFCFLYPAGGQYSCKSDNECPYVVDTDAQGNEYNAAKYTCVSGACTLGGASGNTKKKMGESCYSSQECDGGLFCQPLSQTQAMCTHMCTPGVPATCEQGFVCIGYQSGQGGACVTAGLIAGPNGTDCDTGADCDSGLCATNPLTGDPKCQATCVADAVPTGCKTSEVCVVGINSQSNQGACWPKTEVGGVDKFDEEPCDLDFQCLSGHCVLDELSGQSFCRADCDVTTAKCSAGFWCIELSPNVGACIPGEPPKPKEKRVDGALCDTHDQCKSDYCYKQLGSNAGQCRSACDLTGEDCPGGALCVGFGDGKLGICMEAALPAGSPCDEAADCASQLCLAGLESGPVCSQPCYDPGVCPCGMACVAQQDLGQVCVPSDSGVDCALPGAGCATDLDCENGDCLAGTCAVDPDTSSPDTNDGTVESDIGVMPTEDAATQNGGGKEVSDTTPPVVTQAKADDGSGCAATESPWVAPWTWAWVGMIGLMLLRRTRQTSKFRR